MKQLKLYCKIAGTIALIAAIIFFAYDQSVTSVVLMSVSLFCFTILFALQLSDYLHLMAMHRKKTF